MIRNLMMRAFSALLALSLVTPAIAQDNVARALAIQAMQKASNDAVDSAARSGLLRTMPLEERRAREGVPVNASVQGTTASVPVGAANVLAGQLSVPTIGKIVWLDSVTVSADVAGLYFIAVIGADTTAFGPPQAFVRLSPNQPVTVPIKAYLRQFQGGLDGNVSLFIRNNSSGAAAVVNATMILNATQVTDDLNYSAARTIMAVGDSTWVGSAFGPTKTSAMLPFMVRDYFNDLGSDARVILKSISGSSTASHEGWRLAGWYDVDYTDMLLYNVGINDAIQGTGTIQYLANLDKFWKWFHARRPNAKMIVFAPGPLEDDTSETNAVAIRTAASGYVSGIANPNLIYINLGGSFDRKVTSFYSSNTSTDPVGARRHPSDAGHAAEMVKAKAALQALGTMF